MEGKQCSYYYKAFFQKLIKKNISTIKKINIQIQFNFDGYHEYIGHKGETMKSGCGFLIFDKIKYLSRKNLDTSVWKQVMCLSIN